MSARRLAAGLVILAAMGTVAFLLLSPLAETWRAGGEDAADAPSEASRAVPVTFVEALPRPIEDVERTLATVEAKWSARIAAEVAATVDVIHVDAGDRVEPGMLLASLDARDFEIEVMRTTANVRRIQQMIANSESNVARQRRLADRGHVADAALEAAEAELAALREELQAARSELGRAERNLERTEIRAPHGGIVAERRVSEGDYVTAGTVLLEIPRADRLQVRIPVPEAAAERLRLGMPVRLSTVTSEADVTAEITHIEPRVSAASRTVTVVAEIDNPGGWRPGSSVDAEIVMARRQAIALSPTSVVRRPGGTVVYVIENGIARERAVSLGRRTRDWVEITDGVAAGERVVVDGAGFMTDGTPVEPRPDDRQRPEPGIAGHLGSAS